MLSLFIIFILCYVYWKWHARRQPNEPPMLPGALPFIGHAHMLLGDTKSFWTFFKKLSYKCMEMGHGLCLVTGPYKVYVISDPDDIYTLSNTCFQKDEFGYNFTKELLGGGLLYAPESLWKKHRKLIAPAFNTQILDGYIDIFNSQGKKLVKQLEVKVLKGDFDQSNYIRQNAMETICLTALDDSITEDEASVYVKSFESYLNLNITRFLRFWLCPDFTYKYSTLKKEQDKCVKLLQELSDSVLQKKRDLRKQKTIESDMETKTKWKVFMDVLMDLDDGALTDQEIRDELNTIMMAGHDTSANVLVFTLILIGSHPDVQERIYKELHKVLQDKDVEKHDLSQLVYLEAVLKESMRYYVMAPFVGRYIDREVKLKNCTLKPGHSCYMLLYGSHRNSEWGTDAENFDPDRWLDPARMPKNPNLFVGFSLGKRNCIGKVYAMMSMKVLLSHVLRRYKIQADHTKVILKLDVILKPDSGHFISIENRLKYKN